MRTMSDEWDQDRIRSITVQGWDHEEFVDNREDHGLFETSVTLGCGVGALIQEQDEWWKAWWSGARWENRQPQVVVSLMVNIPGYGLEPPDVSDIGEWVVESFDEALRFLRWFDNAETARQWRYEEDMRAYEEQMNADERMLLDAEDECY